MSEPFERLGPLLLELLALAAALALALPLALALATPLFV
jgi:hypothetical protein